MAQVLLALVWPSRSHDDHLQSKPADKSVSLHLSATLTFKSINKYSFH